MRFCESIGPGRTKIRNDRQRWNCLTINFTNNIIMIRNVNVCAVGPIQSGTSQQTGNQWRKQEFVVEWYESPSDTQSQKIVLSVMNDNIDKLNVQIGDKMEVRFDLRYREYNGRYYMEVYAPFDAMKKVGELQTAGEPAGTAAHKPAAEAAGTETNIPAPQAEGNGDDLPF